MYKEVLFRVTGVVQGERVVYTLCYKEDEAREAGDRAIALGFTDVQVGILRFIRELV